MPGLGMYHTFTRRQPVSLVPAAALWHSDEVPAVFMSVFFASPWLVAIAWTWSRAPRSDSVPQSLAGRARERLWTT
jgi:hypothetical protein